MILGGDIGGTKTNLAFFEIKENQLIISAEKKYSSTDHSSLTEIVADFVKSHNLEVKSACFGIAGPVKNGEAKTTNLPWDVKIENLAKTLQCNKVQLINDLEANAWGINSLKENELCTLFEGKEKVAGNRALISAGTGLGEAGIFFDGKSYHPFATEGGHADFAPRNDKEVALLNYLTKPYGHVSYERVLSGHGLYNIYQFLNDYYKKKTSKEMSEEMLHEDPAMIISKKALEQSDPICVEALDMLISFYGAEAGNCALRFMAYGGVYIGGGIAPKILEKLKTSLFIESFLGKGRLRPILEDFTIKVILNDKTALIGAAYCAKEHL